jgi:hypothetical protein
MRIIAFFAVFLLLLNPISAHAQVLGGVGTRAEGMGGAFVAVADDASAVYWNPAGIATGATFDLQVAKGPGPNLFIGATLPILGATYYRTREVTGLPTVSDSPDRQSGGSGDVQVRTLTTTNFGVTVVQSIVPALVIGTTARVVRGGIRGSEGRTTIDLDAGAMVSVWDMRLGVTARNLRSPDFPAQGGMVRMSRQVRVGAALVPRALPTGVHGPFSLAIDADLTTTPDARGDRRRAAAGGEYWLGKGLVGVRGGIRWSMLGDSRPALSGGFTARLPRSVHVEGQVTKQNESNEYEWTVGSRVTF